MAICSSTERMPKARSGGLPISESTLQIVSSCAGPWPRNPKARKAQGLTTARVQSRISSRCANARGSVRRTPYIEVYTLGTHVAAPSCGLRPSYGLVLRAAKPSLRTLLTPFFPPPSFPILYNAKKQQSINRTTRKPIFGKVPDGKRPQRGSVFHFGCVN